MKQVIEEFKAFAFKGNMIELAVAVIIGDAFGRVVNSLVKNVVMPALSYLGSGGGDYRHWTIGKVEIGIFLGEFVNFLIVAAAVFVVVVKVFGALTKKKASTP